MKDNPINSVDSWIGYCTRLFFNIQALSIIYRVFLDTQVSLAPAHFNYTVHNVGQFSPGPCWRRRKNYTDKFTWTDILCDQSDSDSERTYFCRTRIGRLSSVTAQHHAVDTQCKQYETFFASVSGLLYHLSKLFFSSSFSLFQGHTTISNSTIQSYFKVLRPACTI